MKPKKYLPFRLPPRPQTYSYIVKTPTLEKAVKLNDTLTALIFSRPPLNGHDRFFYTTERKTDDGGVQMSNPYEGFYSVEEAEEDARYFAEAAERLLRSKPQPASFHTHSCFNCKSVVNHECVNPECVADYYSTPPVECPRCHTLTLLPLPGRRARRPYKGKVATLIPPAKAQSVAAD